MSEVLVSIAKDVAAASVVKEQYAIKYQLKPIRESEAFIRNNTKVMQASVDLSVERDGEFYRTSVPLLYIPVKEDRGYYLNGSWVNIISVETKASGFSFLPPGKGTGAADLASNHRVDITPTTSVKNPKMVSGFSIGVYDGALCILKRGKRIPLGKFLRAVTGDSYQVLLDKFGYNHKVLVATLKKEETRDKCIKDVAAMLNLFETNVADMLDVINTRFFSPQSLTLDKSAFERLDSLMSFGVRASDTTCADRLKVPKLVISNGEEKVEFEVVNPMEPITSSTAEKLDYMDLSSVSVYKEDKLFTLRKFYKPHFQCLGATLAEPVGGLKEGTILTVDRLKDLEDKEITTLVAKADGRKKTFTRDVNSGVVKTEHLYQAISILLDNLNGFGQVDSAFDLKSQKTMSPEVQAANRILANLSILTSNLEEKLKDRKNQDEPLVTLLESCFGGWDVDATLNAIQDFERRNVQQYQEINVLAAMDSDSKVTKPVRHTSDSMIGIKDDQFGRLDEIDSPESAQIGKVSKKAFMAKENSSGELCAPYFKVVDGVPDKSKLVYLTAKEEDGMLIADWDETFEDKRVACRKNGTLIYADPKSVDYMVPSPFYGMSGARMVVPLQQNSQPKRLLMATNHGKQARIPMGQSKAFVRSGGESLLLKGVVCAKDLVKYHYERSLDRGGKPLEYFVENSTIRLEGFTIGETSRRYTFVLECDGKLSSFQVEYPFLAKAENQAILSYLVNTNTGIRYKGDDVVVYSDSYNLDKNNLEMHFDGGSFKAEDIDFSVGVSTGVNLFVGYKTWESSSIDDAIVISDRLVGDDTYTTVDLQEFSSEGTSVDGVFTEFTNTDRLSYMESNGLPKPGTWLKAGDKIISRLEPVKKGDVVERREKHTLMPPNSAGQVVSTYIKDNTAYVYVAEWLNIQPGDKMTGRCGNKGVVAKIVPQHLMPFDPVSGRSLDICLNPLGVPSRGNISQILETVLGMASANTGKLCVISPFLPGTTELVENHAELYNAKPRVLVDARTGRNFYRPMTVGYIYMLMLHHKVVHKINSVGTVANKVPGTRDPVKGRKRGGGQTFGEMEMHCLMSYNANKILQEFNSLQSGDEASYSRYLDIVSSDPFAVYEDKGVGDLASTKNLDLSNNNDKMLRCYLRSMGVEMVTNGNTGDISFMPMKDEDIQCLNIKGINVKQKDSIRDPGIFNRDLEDSRDVWSFIPLGCKIVNPLWLFKSQLLSFILIELRTPNKDPEFRPLSVDIVKKILNFKYKVMVGVQKSPVVLHNSVETNVETLSGIDAIVYLFETLTLAELRQAAERYVYGKDNPRKKHYRAIYELDQLIASGIELKDFVISNYPVVPLDYRIDPGIENKSPDFDEYYKSIIYAVQEVGKSNTPVNRTAVFKRILAFSGISNDDINPKYVNLASYFLGKNVTSDRHGAIRDSLMAKVIMHSGRSTIIPTSDSEMTVKEVGVPISMCVSMWNPHLVSYMNWLQANKGFVEFESEQTNLKDWSTILSLVGDESLAKLSRLTGLDMESTERFYSLVRSDVVTYVEGGVSRVLGRQIPRKVVLFGRQPSLHKLGVRAYYVKVVDGLPIQIHPLVCDAYNADFDGDQMWLAALLTYDSTKEAVDKMMADSTVMNPKDSSMALVHAQDLKLGMYFATMLHDNIVDPKKDPRYFSDGKIVTKYYDDVETLRYHVETGNLHVHDLVCLTLRTEDGDRCYLSTAGRILFNSIFKDGFTRDSWENPLGLPMKNPGYLYNLKYDALISGKTKKGNKAEPKSIKLAEITRALIEKDSDLDYALDCFQKLTKFGFLFSDMSCISYTLDDLKNPDQEGTGKVLEISDKLQKKLDDDFNKGLVDEVGRKEANITLYRYAADIYKDIYMNAVDRNNNLFIMLDSSARGNAGQMMMASGIIGVLEKQKGETLEVPILTNYKDGVSVSQMSMISYSARVGVSSTQNDTALSGELTRAAVYLSSGMSVVEEDCHREEKDPNYIKYTVDYESATDRVFKKTSLNLNDLEKLENVTIDGDDSLKHLSKVDEEFRTLYEFSSSDIFVSGSLDGVARKFVIFKHNQLLPDESFIYEILRSEDLSGSVITDNSLISSLYNVVPKSHLKLDKLTLDSKLIHELKKQKVQWITTNLGEYRLEYKLSKRCENQMLGRYSVGWLPSLDKHHCTTAKTVDAIQLYGLNEVDLRTLYDCHSDKGCCARCYGLLLDKSEFPEVGLNVGTVTAQAIGEPSTQLTLSKFHAGGSAGNDTSSGVQILKNSLIYGSPGEELSQRDLVDNSSKLIATQAWDDGYVVIKDQVTTSKKPKVYILGPLDYRDYRLNPRTSVLDDLPYTTVDKELLTVLDGDRVKKFQPISQGYNVPSKENEEIKKGSTIDISREVYRIRQTQMVDFYWSMFHSNGVDVHAKHFELLASIQTALVTVTNSEDPDFKVGGLYEYKNLVGKKVEFIHTIPKSAEVIKYFSGPATLLAYRDANSSLGEIVLSQDKENPKTGSVLASVLTGTNLASKRVKDMPKSNGFSQTPISEAMDFSKGREKDSTLSGLFAMFSNEFQVLEKEDEDTGFEDSTDVMEILGLDTILDVQEDIDEEREEIETEIFSSNVF